MSRADQLIPEGWSPGRNMRVMVQPATDEPVPPAGVWRILDRSPGGPGPHWWLMPHDDAARGWLAAHLSRAVQGCTEVKGLRLAPPGTQLVIPGTARRKGRR